MARKITRDKDGYELHKYKYICKKIRDGKVVSAGDTAFASAYAAGRKEPWPPAQPSFNYQAPQTPEIRQSSQIPEPITVPLDEPLEEDSNATENLFKSSTGSTANSSSAKTPTEQSSASTGEASPPETKSKASSEQARAVGSIFIGYLRSCNDELKRYEGAFVLPEVAFAMLIEPSVHALCEKHAGSVEIGEREQTLVVVAAAGATAGQLFYRKRKAGRNETDSNSGDVGNPAVTEPHAEPNQPPATVHSVIVDDSPTPTNAAKGRLLRSLVSSGAFKVGP